MGESNRRKLEARKPQQRNQLGLQLQPQTCRDRSWVPKRLHTMHSYLEIYESEQPQGHPRSTHVFAEHLFGVLKILTLYEVQCKIYSSQATQTLRQGVGC
ncbi:hypothetical protein EYR41_004791 [Orbilia oligospora]|uniref:Uncharacterized protein n=1 Tax=Orbilia oligospora TaxID=2813651 RepID=A0A7C8KKQ0_ORBOL|nr:hypothetical protein TWF751_006221 [Orbilia oligospora]KAF3248685.1 hypothetical protein TWF217_009044 [Orbilia oligospora]TGJ68700.1 hypothetical protein EYR41_004791 [Orbilia oligospora]